MQQLEESRLKLSQLEQELVRARQQVSTSLFLCCVFIKLYLIHIDSVILLACFRDYAYAILQILVI